MPTRGSTTKRDGIAEGRLIQERALRDMCSGILYWLLRGVKDGAGQAKERG